MLKVFSQTRMRFIFFICFIFKPQTLVSEVDFYYLLTRSGRHVHVYLQSTLAPPRLVLTLTGASLLSPAPRIRLLTDSQGLSSSPCSGGEQVPQLSWVVCRGP